jgi:hypothetical protein
MISMQLWQIGGPIVSDFMVHTSRHLDLSWEEVLFPAPMKIRGMSARSHLFISRYLRTRLKLSHDTMSVDADTDRLIWAIALLPQQHLQQFLCHLGATLAAQEVRQIIEHDAVKAYRQALGDDLYWFTMRCVPLICRTSDTKQGHWGPANIMRAIQSAGRQALQHLIEGYSPDLWRRLQLKLPYARLPNNTPTDIGMKDVGNLHRVALRILRETQTTWIHQFILNADSASPELAR